MTDTPQEIIARAMDDAGNLGRSAELAKAAIAALKEAGLVIVPVEPPEAMIAKMDDVDYALNVESVKVGERYKLLYRAAIQQGEK